MSVLLDQDALHHSDYGKWRSGILREYICVRTVTKPSHSPDKPRGTYDDGSFAPIKIHAIPHAGVPMII
ncbi:unnamed protein product [Clonostachys chloroleuca]|uniref:Uncharacterized protein n=1 Tax=Clonostachys chloroleuca TaxID=1926264 RepID=A0AA35QBZ7_9HYPO|nr:unnamed protein product [Clonostachys chloroleuca]